MGHWRATCPRHRSPSGGRGLAAAEIGWTRKGKWPFTANLNLFETRCADVFPLGDHPIAERPGRCLRRCANDKSRAGALCDIQRIVALVLRDEYVIALAFYDGAEPAVERDPRLAIRQFAEAEIFEPILGAFHTIETPVRPVGKRHGDRFHLAEDGEVSIDDDIPVELASSAGGSDRAGDQLNVSFGDQARGATGRGP